MFNNKMFDLKAFGSVTCQGYESSDHGKEDTPVPISNTEVKLLSAENTWWETAWEDRTLLVSLFLGSSMVEQPAVNR